MYVGSGITCPAVSKEAYILPHSHSEIGAAPISRGVSSKRARELITVGFKNRRHFERVKGLVEVVFLFLHGIVLNALRPHPQNAVR